MRQQIRNEIAAIKALDALEQEQLIDALSWIDSDAELFRIAKPATPAKHLVSYFAVVDDGHILLVDHKNAQLWLPAGGHVEIDEHPRDTVLRELQEELGFTPSHEIDAPLMLTCATTVGHTAGHTDVSLWYVVHASRKQELQFDTSEFNAIRWFRFSEVPLQRSDPHMSRFLNKLSSQQASLCSSTLRNSVQ